MDKISIRKPDYAQALEDVDAEIFRAVNQYSPMASSHEGYAILLEEVDELWEEVKIKQALQSKERMRAEAIQVAAMAIRFAVDICK